MLPRTLDLSVEIGRFRAEMSARMASGGREPIEEWLMKEYRCDPGSARSITSYFREQLAVTPEPPSNRRLLIEAYRDSRGNFSLIFHYCFGRRTNDALSRAYASALSKEHKVNVSVSLSESAGGCAPGPCSGRAAAWLAACAAALLARRRRGRAATARPARPTSATAW